MEDSARHQNRKQPPLPLEFYQIHHSGSSDRPSRHAQNKYEIFHICEGALILFSEDHQICCKTGDCLIVPEQTAYRIAIHDCTYEKIAFDVHLLFPACCQSEVRKLSSLTLLKKGSPKNKTLSDFFEFLQHTSVENSLSVLSELYYCFSIILQNSPCQNGQNRDEIQTQRLAKVLRFIETHYSSTVTLQDLATICGMSPKYFCRFFKKMTKKTPIDYLNSHRIQVASEMLLQTKESVTEISLNCGFNDLSYFIKTFKRYQGMSPNRYRKQTI